MLDLTAFENAVNSLIEIIERYNREYKDTAIRDAVIQRFEYTYSLALKMIKRYFLISAFGADDAKAVNGMTFNQMVRTANDMGLLKSNLEIWDNFRQKHNMTSHTYDENIAKKVVTIVPDFKDEAVFLLNRLKEKLD